MSFSPAFEKMLSLYVEGQTSRDTFIKALRELEKSGMYFALDGNRLLLQNHTFRLAIDIDPEHNSYQILDAKAEHGEIVTAPKTSEKKTVSFAGTARQLEEELLATMIVREILANFSPDEFDVQTGGYPEGIPHIASLVARDLGFDTRAIVPAVINETAFVTTDTSHYSDIVTVGLNWGDETETFVLWSDMIFFIGGGFWTQIEYLSALRQKKKIYFLKGLGGFSDTVVPTTQSICEFVTPIGILKLLSLS